MRSLIVEDDFIARELLQIYLADYGDISFAINGKEAVRAVEESFDSGKPYDLICLDIKMPEMDGLEALRHIRKLERDRAIDGLDGTKVIMTTSSDLTSDIFDSFNIGCEAYIVKPIKKETLLEEMAKLGLTK